MDYINFDVVLSVESYVWLEKEAKKLNISKNELIQNAIYRLLTRMDKGSKSIKNAGFYNPYN